MIDGDVARVDPTDGTAVASLQWKRQAQSLRLIETTDNVHAVFIVSLSHLRRLYVACIPVQQSRAEPLLKRLNVSCDKTWRNTQIASRPLQSRQARQPARTSRFDRTYPCSTPPSQVLEPFR